jgi:hypothetical protein
MYRKPWILALPLFAALLPAARRASATPPDRQPAAAATAVVENQLVKPLADKEARRSRFSRAYIPPQTRRVRILDGQPSTDGRGAFLAFAVDERSGAFPSRKADDPRGWRTGAIVGCVYPAREEVFIKRGDKFFGAGLLLGQRTAAADAAVCRPSPPAAQLPASGPRRPGA